MASIETMREYVSVIKHQSFTAAARELYVSQPTITRHVKELENEFGTLLVERGAHGVRPTEAGRCVCEGFEEILERYQEVGQRVEQLRTGQCGEIVLAVLYHAVSELALSTVMSFMQLYPGVRVSFSSCQPNQALAQLDAGEADVAILFDTLQPVERFDFVPTFKAENMCVVDCDNPLASAPTVTRERLADMTLVHFPCYESEPQAIRRLFDCPRLEDGEQIDMLPMHLRGNDTFTLLDGFLKDKLDARLRFVPIAPDPPVLTYGFACRKDESRKEVRDLMAIARRELRAT